MKKLFVLIALILSGTAHAQTDDMVLVEELVDFIYEDGGFYTITPWSQRDTICFRAHVLNNGSNAQTNVRLHVQIKDTSQLVVYDDTSAAIPSIASGVDDTLLFITGQNCFVPPDTFMNYTIYYDILQDEVDQNPANDIDTISIEMADSVYARDYGSAQNFRGPHDFPGGGFDGDRIGTYYDIVDTTTITSVSFFVGPQTSLSMDVFAQVYELDNACMPDDLLPFAQSQLTPFYPTDLNSWKTIRLPETTLLPSTSCPNYAGGKYLVALEIYGYSGNNFLDIGEDLQVNQPGDTSFYNNLLFQKNNITWLNYGGGQPMIRLNTYSKVCGTFNASVVLIINESSLGANDGEITVAASGGVPPYTYSWSNGDTDAIADSLASGIYFVTICDTNNCCKTLVAVLWGDGNPGISESESLDAITIHPNPTEGKFEVRSWDLGVETIEIYDLFGRLVLRTNEPEIDMSGFQKGMYFVQVGEVVKKVILQ